jgi:hypothetical protein
MAKADFYMVYVSLKSDIGHKALEEKMNLSVDWYRMSDSLWILYTTSDQEKWYSRLKPLCNYVFVCRLDTSQRQGWMKKAFWRWLRREKT